MSQIVSKNERENKMNEISSNIYCIFTEAPDFFNKHRTIFSLPICVYFRIFFVVLKMKAQDAYINFFICIKAKFHSNEMQLLFSTISNLIQLIQCYLYTCINRINIQISILHT